MKCDFSHIPTPLSYRLRNRFSGPTKVLRNLNYVFFMAVLAICMGDRARAESAQIWEVPVGYFFVNTPTTGDLDGDGLPEIVVTASGGDPQSITISSSGIVTAVAHDGTILPGWPVITNDEAALLPPTRPAVADIDGDGQADVVLGHGHILYVFHGNGQLMWKHRVDGIFKKKPEIADLDGDGQLEIINGADQFLGQAQVHIWRANGETYPGSPLLLNEYYVSSPSVYLGGECPLLAIGSGNGYNNPAGSLYLFACEHGELQLRWRLNIGQHPISKPVFADLDGDGDIDLVGGTYSPSVYAIRTSDGKFLPGWPRSVRGSIFTTPAVYQDATQTMIFAVDLSGILYAWDRQGRLLWNVQIDPSAIDQMTLANMDDDPESEIILGVNGGVRVFDLNGTELNRWDLGDYWVTGIQMAPQQPSDASTFTLGGVNNFTEEAKLFIFRF